MVYITALFPYFVLIIFFVRALTLKVTIWYFTMICTFIQFGVLRYQVLGSILIFLFVEALVVKVNQAIIGHLFLRELVLMFFWKGYFDLVIGLDNAHNCTYINFPSLMNWKLLWLSNKKHSIYLSSIKFYVQFLIVKWSESKYFSCFSNHLMTKYVFLHLPGHGGWRCSSLYTKGEKIQIVKSVLYHVPRNRFSLLWSKYLLKMEIIFCFSLSCFWTRWLGLRLEHRWVSWTPK